jgi:hypothetical protein
MKCKDIYGVMQHSILTIKDHSTELIFYVALPKKKASYDAHKLENHFGLVEYSCIFHTDNGKKFTAANIC